VTEQPFEISVADGVLLGHRGADGRPALLLHGGPALSDYTQPLADELDGLFSTIRYTQRGTPPSTVGPPFTVESHLADALAVLDFFQLEQAWAVGHSWGGHLALHLAVAYPERLSGIICVNPLGASDEVFEEFEENLRRGLPEAEIRVVDDIDARWEEGITTPADRAEWWRIMWPQYFSDPETAPPMPHMEMGGECSTDTNASIAEHFKAGTLEKGLPGVRLPALVVHGELDPLPLRTAAEAAQLIPGAALEVLPGPRPLPLD
jgi:pimeloyl-ACP methyl ester carboxylesterase